MARFCQKWELRWDNQSTGKMLATFPSCLDFKSENDNDKANTRGYGYARLTVNLTLDCDLRNS